ncbi:MAG: hypothetical protein MPJ50_07330 [Pirellulales bacterium]|nr:hypothetical protein [Pirellulales bacterium]
MRSIRQRHLASSLLAALLLFATDITVMACPFCDAVRPTWSQLREPAQIVALAEVTVTDAQRATLRLVEVAHGHKVPGKVQISPSAKVSPGDLILLFGQTTASSGAEAEQIQWSDLPISKPAYDYLRAAPDLRRPPEERLRYFARFLEDADEQIAEDAYMEFAHAPYSDVAAIGDTFDGDLLKTWLKDRGVPDDRKGFYALALALSRGSKQDQQENVQFLRDWVDNPGDDFRRGLDGVMGALLLAEKNTALELIREKFLANPQAANGHVRNALSAVRFYYEFGEQPDTEAIASAVACLLDRPAFATEAIIDLARWEAWDKLPKVVSLFDRDGYDVSTRHAVVAYLLTSDKDDAAVSLERLRELDADFVNASEERFLLFGGIR